MRFGTPSSLVLGLLGLLASPAEAHFNMLLPQAASAKRGDSVTLIYQWGHPFEHQLFDAPAPAAVSVRSPDGTMSDLRKALEKVTAVTSEGKKAAAYRLRFTPTQRGDFLFTLASPPIWMEEDREFLQDHVKVVLHVQAQKGWGEPAGQAFEMVPLTRPYGLQPGMVFQAQALADGRPLGAAMVEIEHYNPKPPGELPPDEQITRTARTDPNGVVTCTLTEPGWWCVTTQRDGGQQEHKGKAHPVRQRATIWVFVDEKVTAK
jgi:cobalt/nickel transport protein